MASQRTAFDLVNNQAARSLGAPYLPTTTRTAFSEAYRGPGLSAFRRPVAATNAGLDLARSRARSLSRFADRDLSAAGGLGFSAATRRDLAARRGLSRYSGLDPARFSGPDLARFSGPDLARFSGPDLARFSGPDLARFSGPGLSALRGPDILAPRTTSLSSYAAPNSVARAYTFNLSPGGVSRSLAVDAVAKSTTRVFVNTSVSLLAADAVRMDPGALSDLIRIFKGRTHTASSSLLSRRPNRLLSWAWEIAESLAACSHEQVLEALTWARRWHRRLQRGLSGPSRRIPLRAAVTEIASTVMPHGPPVSLAMPTRPAVASCCC
jgi:hypothetical protein